MLVDGSQITADDTATWNAAMDHIYRFVDLEGIKVDSLGYTVRITGPPPKQRRLKLWKRERGSGKNSDFQRDQEKSSCSVEKGVDKKLKIVTMTNYDVT
jgi:hypothetical protein